MKVPAFPFRGCVPKGRFDGDTFRSLTRDTGPASLRAMAVSDRTVEESLVLAVGFRKSFRLKIGKVLYLGEPRWGYR